MNLDLIKFLVKLLKYPQPVYTSWQLFFSISRKKKKKKKRKKKKRGYYSCTLSRCFCRSLLATAVLCKATAIRWDTYSLQVFLFLFPYLLFGETPIALSFLAMMILPRKVVYIVVYIATFLSLCGSLSILALSH